MGKKRALGRPGKSKKRRFNGNRRNGSAVEFSENVADCSEIDPVALQDLSDSPNKFSGSSSPDSSDSSSDADSSTESDIEDGDCTGFRLIDLLCLQQLLSICACCSSCHGPIILTEVGREGLASRLELSCADCGESRSEFMSQKFSRVWEVNRRAVLAVRWIGRSLRALVKFAAALNMPVPMTFASYNGHAKALHKSSKIVAQNSMAAAASSIRAQAGHVEQVCDTAVTYDGTWMRRGFASLHGVFVAIAWDIGKIVDVEVLSRFCHLCSHLNSRRKKQELTDAEYQEKKAAHVCAANTTVSSPAMESAAAKLIWARSEETRKQRYTIFIGDGDTKSYKSVCESRPYGAAVTIEKEECVGHVQKRVGSNLRKLRKDLAGKKLSDGLPISGRGRLTEKVIELLQAYYGMAVRSHPGNLQDMARAIWAGLMHRVSTDDKPQHQFCPPGLTSWCKWQQEKAGGPKYKHHDSLSEAILQVIKPIYIRLAERSLLQRCLRGATQNANESFNGLVWQMCPKVGFCSSRTVETAVFLAAAWFNDGGMAFEHLLEEMALPVGDHTRKALKWLDEERRKNLARKSSDDFKQSRKKRRRIRKGMQDEMAEVEGVLRDRKIKLGSQ